MNSSTSFSPNGPMTPNAKTFLMASLASTREATSSSEKISPALHPPSNSLSSAPWTKLPHSKRSTALLAPPLTKKQAVTSSSKAISFPSSRTLPFTVITLPKSVLRRNSSLKLFPCPARLHSSRPRSRRRLKKGSEHGHGKLRRNRHRFRHYRRMGCKRAHRKGPQYLGSRSGPFHRPRARLCRARPRLGTQAPWLG